MSKEVNQPKEDIQRILDDILEATPETIRFRGKNVSVGWLHKGTLRKFSSVQLKEKNPLKKNTKQCALVLLNSWLKIALFYSIYWRWLYYIADVDEVDILAVLNAGKKKVQSDAFYLNTILATGMTDTMMTMTKAEAKRTQAEQVGDPHIH